jgi:hypothetical protein
MYYYIEDIAQLVERTAHNSNYKCSSHFFLIYSLYRMRVGVIVRHLAHDQKILVQILYPHLKLILYYI